MSDTRTEIELLKNELRWVKKVVLYGITGATAFVAAVLVIFFGVEQRDFRQYVRDKIENSVIAFATEQATNAAASAVEAKSKAVSASERASEEFNKAAGYARRIYYAEDSLHFSVITIPVTIQCGDTAIKRANPFVYDFDGKGFGKEVMGAWLVPVRNVDVYNEYIEQLEIKQKWVDQKNEVELTLTTKKDGTGDLSTTVEIHLLIRKELNTEIRTIRDVQDQKDFRHDILNRLHEITI